jgi:hypothetical protein
VEVAGRDPALDHQVDHGVVDLGRTQSAGVGKFPLRDHPLERARGGPPVSAGLALGAAGPSGAAGVLVTVHERLGYAFLIVLAAGLVLALLAVRDVRRLPTVRAYLWLAVAALVLQGIAGEGLHLMYGPLALVSLPLTVLFARGWAPRREAWTFAAGFLVALLLAIRALMTG